VLAKVKQLCFVHIIAQIRYVSSKFVQVSLPVGPPQVPRFLPRQRHMARGNTSLYCRTSPARDARFLRLRRAVNSHSTLTSAEPKNRRPAELLVFDAAWRFAFQLGDGIRNTDPLCAAMHVCRAEAFCRTLPQFWVIPTALCARSESAYHKWAETL
jgi:hypothetical protein